MQSTRSLPASARLATLRRLAVPPVDEKPAEQCELCSAPLAAAHRHLVESAKRRILCACDGCAMTFNGVVGGRFSLIPRDARRVAAATVSDEQWADWALPIDLVFIFHSTPVQRPVALYPGAAGVIESQLRIAGDALGAVAPVELPPMQPDVEALLLNRCGTRRLAYVAPIDACFGLAGLIRMHWRGLAGGPDVWREVDAFFARLDAAAGEEVACA